MNIKNILYLTLVLFWSCTNETITITPTDEDIIEEEIIEEEIIEEEIVETINPNPIGESAGTVEYLNKDLVDDNYILINDAGNNFVFLMNKDANVLHQWNLKGGDLGNDGELLPNGKLLVMVESEDPKILLGGFGGKIELMDKNGTVEWSFIHSTDDYILHHDAEMLPNGNVLIQTWERRTAEESIEFGYKMDIQLYPDGIIEVNPTSNEIVWEWHMWDHLIQDFDESKSNYGTINENPHLIDINYTQLDSGDISHANGISYDANKDIIYLSANFYSEVWVIDHSTSTLEASSHTGGTYNKGGDLIFRFGNPTTYKNTTGERLFNNNHFPNLLKGEHAGNMLIFSNGADLNQSTVYELKIPDNFSLISNVNNEPEVVWSFTDTELYSPKVSGAVKLPNGNTLIAEGDFGIWEVTPSKEIVWKFQGDGFYWRAYSFSKNDPIILDILQ
tara:strand:+ start:6722 stop:8062 length:1341 start_codon:yes stop_codon:yes gene_type:complete